ncbi:MAG: signal peptidase II [Bacteroidota bacterium]
MKKYLALLLILFTGCGTDLQTKNWAAESLKNDRAYTVIPDIFEFRYAENIGVAFSFLTDLSDGLRLPLIISSVLLASLMIVYLAWKWRQLPFAQLLPLFLVLSGAMGNLIDRIINGYVIDFLHFHYHYEYNFPIFNVADVLIFCGVVLMIFHYAKGRYAEAPI